MDINATTMEMDELNNILNKFNEKESSQRQQIYGLRQELKKFRLQLIALKQIALLRRKRAQ